MDGRPVSLSQSSGAHAPASDAAWLQGGGEMGARVRSLDWAKTPLGPADRWPQSLRSLLSIMLASKAQLILFWGPEYVVLYNDAYRPVFGAKHPNMLGMPGRIAWSEIWDTGANLHTLLDGVVQTGEAFSARDMLFFLERNGFAEETYFDVSYDPVRDESGRVGGVFCIVTETTGRVVGERRLALLKDLAARNAAARTPAEACVLAIETLAGSPHDVEFALAYLADELEAYTPGGREALAAAGARRAVELPFPSGKLVVGLSERRPFDEQYRSFVALVADQVGAAVANARAHEEERERAESLAELDRAKTAFFSNVSHEFRTPLTLMLGPLEDVLASTHGPLPEAVAHTLAVAHSNALRLLKLVNSLLDFARIEAGRVEACYEATDLATFTADLASVFRSAAERAGLKLLVSCEPLREPVYVDGDLWEKIVLNLLSNALKFTFEGEIEVTLRDRGAAVELAVRDTGVGIAAADLPKLFQRFHRVRNARSRTHEGSGIGLALVRELVKLHGGEIAVDSEEHVGTTFTVSLPKGREHLPPERIGGTRQLATTRTGAQAFLEEAVRLLPAAAGEPPTATAERAAPGTARPRILLADDNADMRDYVGRLLERHYDVVAVGDGQQALEALRDEAPDLVLTDVMMPRLDGFGLLAAIRAEPRTRSLPVVMLSARAGEEARIDSATAGADDYLVKPFSARELLARVGSQLKLARQRGELERALRYRSEQLETLIAAAPLGIYLVGADFRICAVNPVAQQSFGDVPGGVEGRDFEEVMQLTRERSHADDIVRIFRRTLATGEPYFTREQAVIRNGSHTPEHHEWRVERITLPDGERGLVCYFRDISAHVAARTAVEESREALKDADRRKDEFLATLAHELRTPLAPIHNALQILHHAGPDGAVARSVYDMMERQVNHMVRLVDDLMEVSRITRGKIELRRERIELAAVVGSAVETTRPLIDAAGHALTVDLGDEPLELDADPVRLAQVFGNILNNAAKYTPSGGQITVRAERRGSQVVVAVRDNGAGIRPEVLAHVFDPFVQGERSYNRSQGGLGIGLTLARNIVALHGGTIEASSAGLGKGAEVTVRLPLLAPAAVATAAQAALPATRIAGQRVLIVDDNVDAAESLGVLLRCLGAEVVTVHDGPAALEALRTQKPAAAVLDIGMPGMDGYEVARRARAAPDGADVMLIALTGWGNDEDRRRSREAGIDYHLVKPVDLQVLEDLLASAARRAAVDASR
jgi:PAS domain S-box-containing protein